MVSERNRIIELSEYLSSLGIEINIGKNKARGHKGIFLHGSSAFRIDISKNLEDKDILSVILHEFAHYIHYSYDKTLKSLEFAFGELTDDIKEELINITVQDIPKGFASSIYAKKQELAKEIKIYADKMKQINSEFKLSDKNKEIERKISSPLRYLLKYDRIKYFDKIYSVENIDRDFCLSEEQKLYIIIKSKQRALNRINNRISRYNKYYNNPSELFARFIDLYYTRPNYTRVAAPNSCKLLEQKNISLLKKINNIFL